MTRTYAASSTEVGSHTFALLGGVHDHLAHSGMRVDHGREVVQRQSVADGHPHFADDLDGVDAHDGGADQPIVLGVRVQLCQSLGFALAKSFAIALVAGLADLHLDAGGFRRLRVVANHRDLRVRVDARRHNGAVHWHHTVIKRVLNRAIRLGAGKVRQLQATDAIARRPDMRVLGAKHAIYLDVVSLIDDDTRVLQPDAARLRAPADRHEHEVGLDVGAVVEVSGYRCIAVIDGRDVASGVKGDSLLLDDTAELGHDPRLDAGKDLGQNLDHGDLRTQGHEQAGEFAADHTAPDDKEVPGHRFETQDAV